MKKIAILQDSTDKENFPFIHGRQRVTLLPASGGNIVYIDVYKLTPRTQNPIVNSISLLSKIKKILFKY